MTKPKYPTDANSLTEAELAAIESIYSGEACQGEGASQTEDDASAFDVRKFIEESEAKLNDLHGLVGEYLIRRLQSGEPLPEMRGRASKYDKDGNKEMNTGELSAAIAFLKANQFTLKALRERHSLRTDDPLGPRFAPGTSTPFGKG